MIQRPRSGELEHMLDDAFVANLPSDTDQAIQLICRAYAIWNARVKPADRLGEYNQYVDAFSFLVAFCKSRSVKVEAPRIDASDRAASLARIDMFFNSAFRDAVSRTGQALQERATAKYSDLLGSAFFYEFSKDDLEQIRVLLNELKNEIWKTDEMEDRHKGRLRVRVEKLEQELHEKSADLDRYLALITEVRVLEAKLDSGARPIVSRIKRILKIVLKVQAEAEGVPLRSLMRVITISASG